ncbi:MAG: hypothetical protein MI757_01025, partial [Pirellulales bacterium]|nr:hypothetical protein [Pirellulales bacterium]
KLDRRFPGPKVRPVRPKVVGSGLLNKKPLQSADSNSVWSLRPLEERLLSPAAPQWAMIDARGKLVTSRDRDDVASLFHRARARLEPVVVKNAKELRSVLVDGRTLVGRIEENPDDPSRPIVTVRIEQTLE